MKRSTKVVLAALATLQAGTASAAISAAPIVAEIGLNGAELLLIGAAILAVVYTVRAFSWARKV